MIEEIREIPTADGLMGVITKRPDGGGPFPVVVLFHDGPGIREATHKVVRRLAAAGFYALATDRYHRFGRFVHFEPEALIAAGRNSKLMRNFFGMVMATTDYHVRGDVDSLLHRLGTDPAARPGPMGCLGFCNGVRSVLRAMSGRPGRFASGVGLHPSFCIEPDDDSPHLGVSRLEGELYLAFGGADHVASVEHNGPLIDEARKLGGRAAVDVFPGTDHGFAMPGPTYDGDAAERAFGRAVALFRRTLG